MGADPVPALAPWQAAARRDAELKAFCANAEFRFRLVSEAQRLRFAEARPVKHATTAAANHLGPLAMYLAAGFSIVREDDEGNVYVRKRLG